MHTKVRLLGLWVFSFFFDNLCFILWIILFLIFPFVLHAGTVLWSPITTLPRDYYVMDVSGNSYAYAAAYDSGNIYYSTNYGVTWQQSTVNDPPEGGANWISIDTDFNGGYVIACADSPNGLVYKSEDFGYTFSPISGLIEADYRSVSISVAGQQTMITVCEDGELVVYTSTYYFTDYSAQTFTEGVLACTTAIVPRMTNNIWYILQNNKVYYTLDFGVSWYTQFLANTYFGETITYTGISANTNFNKFCVILQTDTYSLARYGTDDVTFFNSDLILEVSEDTITSLFVDYNFNIVFISTINGATYTSINSGQNYILNSPTTGNFNWQSITADYYGTYVLASGFTENTQDPDYSHSMFSGVFYPIIPTMEPTTAPSQAPSFAPTIQVAGTYLIATVAGDINSGVSSGDAGPASSAGINTPTGIWCDPLGNMWIAEGVGYRIRFIDATTNVISTVVGTGVNGFAGDGAAATSAEISTVFQIFGTGAANTGYIYIADTQNCKIRQLNKATKVIVTYAGIQGALGSSGDGGKLTAAGFNQPIGVFGDSAGSLYISEYNGQVVRKIEYNRGVYELSTFVGTGGSGSGGDLSHATSATLTGPTQLFVDSSNAFLYIAAEGNNKIRRVDLVTKIISTFAGTGNNAATAGGGEFVVCSIRL